ncbi:N-acetyltransferase [bacterium]|nr:N-acetyltransferase [bacterium]
MESNIIIRQALKSDSSTIAEFLSRAVCVHRHLDWQAVLDWIPFDPFLLMQDEYRLQAVLSCPPDLEKIAWIRCFACDKKYDLTNSWDTLFKSILSLPIMTGTTLYSVGLHDWFANLLDRSGFTNFQNIVVLQWNEKMPAFQPYDQLWWIRPMEEADLDQVAELDQTAFEPIWVNPPDKVRLAYAQAEHASVVELDNRIIGYEMTTANHISAHLARIATHPDYQHQHIGSSLIAEMFGYFLRKGIRQITVNTQSTNTASLALYKSLGFELTGENFPVYQYKN